MTILLLLLLLLLTSWLRSSPLTPALLLLLLVGDGQGEGETERECRWLLLSALVVIAVAVDVANDDGRERGKADDDCFFEMDLAGRCRFSETLAKAVAMMVEGGDVP